VSLANEFKGVGTRNLAARYGAIRDNCHAMLLASGKHFVLIDEGMHLDLVADERL
jgi:hypothetical protein